MISCHISGCYGQCWCGLRVTRHFAIIQRVLAKIEDNGTCLCCAWMSAGQVVRNNCHSAFSKSTST